MSKDAWSDRLSEYLDGDLNRAETEAFEAHLATCAECSATLDELRGVVARARSLDDRPPAHDLWSGIAERIGAAGTAGVRPITSAPAGKRGLLARRLTLSVPQLAAAAVVLVVLSATLVGSLVRRAPVTRAAGVPTTPVMTVAAASDFGGARYDSAVVELERALAANRGQLDTLTVRVIRQNLAIIDQAIDQARRALAADPGSAYLNDHLAGTLRRKIELLRQVTLLTVQS
ncbi:MAG: zf-HC2 domain-containing protein [Gemmatimonadetes bacterium]|nr:zf-HC2 domain-containing protein [Gemmatimonadota bacterium]